MKKLIIPIILLFLLAISVYSLDSISRFGYDSFNSGALTSTKDGELYTINWTTAGYSNSAPLVFDLDNDGRNEIIFNGAGTIKIFNATGTAIDTYIYPGLDNRQITAYNSDNCNNGYALYVVNSTGSLGVMCLDSGSLTLNFTIDSGLTGLVGNTGPSVIREGGKNYAVYVVNVTATGNNSVVVCNETGKTSASYDIGPYLVVNDSVAPVGDLRGDGYNYWLFMKDGAILYMNRQGAYYNLTISTLGNLDLTRYPLIIDMGGGSADNILIPFYTIGPPCPTQYILDRWWYGTATGTLYSDFIPPVSDVLACEETKYTNAVQLGAGGDICYQYGAEASNNFVCRNPNSLSWTYQETATKYWDSISAGDIDNDGYADFMVTGLNNNVNPVMTSVCKYIDASTPLSCSKVSNTSNFAYAVDIDDDGFRDLLISDIVDNVFKVKLSGGTSLSYGNCPGEATNPLYAYDIFNYTNPIESCYWYLTPSYLSVSPTASQLCYTGTADFELSLWGNGNNYADSVFSESFDLTLNDTSFFEHTFFYRGQTGTPTAVFTIDIFGSSNGSIQYYTYTGGVLTSNSLCSNCFTPSAKNNFKFIIYNYDAVGYTIFNSSSGSFQAVQPNTFSVQINGGSPYFNIPHLQNTTYPIPEYAYFTLYDSYMCLDNYYLYAGASSELVTTNQTYDYGSAPVGAWVGFESAYCYTGYAEYGKCSLKPGGYSCSADNVCLSNECINGKCSSPGAWASIDNFVSLSFGSDSSSLMFIAIFIIVAMTMGVIFSSGGSLAGVIAGAGLLFISTIFFLIVGWLPAFFVIGLVILVILIIALLIILRG